MDGGFIVTWKRTYRRTERSNFHRAASMPTASAYGDDFIVNTLHGRQSRAFPVVATSGANVLTVWEDFGARGPRRTPTPTGIRGQAFTTTAFDYDSARFGDFDNNGRDDILFQNDTGDLTIWRTNSAGVCPSIIDIGSLPAGFRVDGTGNFNSTAGDDILLRSPTQVAVLPMNGIVAPADAGAGRHLAGLPQFRQRRLHRRRPVRPAVPHTSTTARSSTWGVANNALTAAPKVLGSAPAAVPHRGGRRLHRRHQADILFRDVTTATSRSGGSPTTRWRACPR